MVLSPSGFPLFCEYHDYFGKDKQSSTIHVNAPVVYSSVKKTYIHIHSVVLVIYKDSIRGIFPDHLAIV